LPVRACARSSKKDENNPIKQALFVWARSWPETLLVGLCSPPGTQPCGVLAGAKQDV
jgi:hypothetical protein